MNSGFEKSTGLVVARICMAKFVCMAALAFSFLVPSPVCAQATTDGDPGALVFEPPSLEFLWEKGRRRFPASQRVKLRNANGYDWPSGSFDSWLSMVHTNIPNGYQMSFSVQPAKLDVGVHETKVILRSQGKTATLPVKITVVAADGKLQVNRKQLNFGGFLGDAIKEQAIDLTYTGVGTTKWTASGPAWLKLSQAGGTVAATKPTTLSVGINPAAITAAGRVSGTLKVGDGKTTYEISVNLSVIPPGSPTIELFGLEATQGIQNLLNDIPFVANRPTFVRGHVRSFTGDPIEKVTAELIATRDGVKLGSLAPINPGGSINIIANPDRAKLDDSFLFQLDPSWLTGTVTLRLEGKSQPIAYLLPRPVPPRPVRTQAKADSGWVPQARLKLGPDGGTESVIVHHEREGKIIGRYVFLGQNKLVKGREPRSEDFKQILTQAGYDTKEIVDETSGVIAPHSEEYPQLAWRAMRNISPSGFIITHYARLARFGDVLRFEKVGGEPGGENERQYVVNSNGKGEWFSPKTTSGETYRLWHTDVDVSVGMRGALPTPVPRNRRVSTTEPAPAEKSLTGGVANDGEDRPQTVTLTFQTIPALPIEYYLYSEQGSVKLSDGRQEDMTYTANAVHAAATSQQLLAGLPIPRVDDTIHATTLTYSGNRIGNQDKVDVIMREAYEKAGSPLRHTYGLFARYEPTTDPEAQPAGGPGGVAVVPGFFGFGEYYSFQSMATLNMHEIGHNLGRNHVDCGKPASPDTEYPHANHQISDELSGLAAYYGFNIVTKKDIYPPTYKDYMSYCHPSWVSPYTYKAMMERLKIHYKKPDGAGGQSAGSPGAPILLVSGSITGAGTATVEGSIDRVVDDNASAAIPIPAADGSKYSVRLLDASGGTIATYPVTPEKSESQAAEGHDHGEFTSFTLAVPRPKKMARVVLLHENKPLAERKASANAPTVTLTTPLVGKVFGTKAIPLTWKAGDVDGDKLRFNVDYSKDGGTTWHVLARNWSETTLNVESSRLAGSAKARLRVSANDGFLTTFAVSDAFTVSDHPPVAIILSKDLNRYYVGGQTILLEGTGYDFEEGVVNELTWYSDRNGKLGSGRTLSLNADDLAEGAHVLRLEVKDSKGQSSFGDPAAGVAASANNFSTASDSVQFDVYYDPLSVPAELLAASVMSDKTQRIEAGLTNPGFEEPRVEDGTFVLVETMPGWKTTDTHFEIWGTGFKEVAAHEGTQFVELNAYINGTLYQDSTGIQPGSVLEFTFAHRGRNGEDTMKLTITDLGADNSLEGGDDTVLFTKQYTTGKDAWAVYDSTTEPKIVALGNTVRFAYGAISTATGELGEGNFLDAANFGVGVVSSPQAATDTKAEYGSKRLQTFGVGGESTENHYLGMRDDRVGIPDETNPSSGDVFVLNVKETDTGTVLTNKAGKYLTARGKEIVLSDAREPGSYWVIRDPMKSDVRAIDGWFSLESASDPGRYLRHYQFKAFAHKEEELSQNEKNLFLADATWRIVDALAPQPTVATNPIGMDFSLIPAGTFMMGSPESEAGREDDEVQHGVTITRDYYIGVTEVTQSQWQQVMGTTPWKGQEQVIEGNDIAASYISWNDAVEFCRKLSEQEGRRYRLPTEAEWEYACRGGTTTAYSFGDDVSQLEQSAWYRDSELNHSSQVKQKSPNGFGLYDMHGNLLEFCQDWYGAYPQGSVTDPPGPSSGTKRIGRGGSFLYEAPVSRSACRRFLDDSAKPFQTLGLRVVLVPGSDSGQLALNEAPPENAMKLDVDGGAFTFGYRTTAMPGFNEFPNTDSPHPGIMRRNIKDGDYFSFAQNTLETELKVQETGLVHYPAKAEGSGVLCPGINPGDIAIARFTAMADGEYKFKISAELIEEDPTGAGVTIYVNGQAVDQQQLTGHLVPWTTSFQRKLTKGQTLDIAVDNGVDKNWEKDHVLITAKAWTTRP